MATTSSQGRAPSDPGEREIVDYLVEHFDGHPREVVVNYYVALKTTHFVILAGPREAGKEYLARGLARALVGQPSFQWSPMRAHAWWTTRTRSPRQLAEAHARFNTMKLRNFIEAASTCETLGLPFSFFARIGQLSAAEVVCYFEDLPRGLFWEADGSITRMHVPENLFITGTLNAEENEVPILGPRVHRHAITIPLDADLCPPAPTVDGPARARLEWQQTFVTAGTRRSKRARAKLARILPDRCAPLAHLNDLARLLETPHVPASISQNAWLYLANAFDQHGRGLFVEPAVENLAIAQDYVMAQSVIPAMHSRWAKTPGTEETIGEYLAPRLPRSYTQWSARLRAV